MRNAILLENRDHRQTAAVVSDGIYYALAVYPLVVDTAIVTWGVHGAGDVAFQMMLINFESYALTGAIALTAEKLGRVRPMARECATDPGYDGKCGNQGALNLSFLSGHTTIAFAGAGLMCAHHTNLPLYGSKRRRRAGLRHGACRRDDGRRSARDVRQPLRERRAARLRGRAIRRLRVALDLALRLWSQK